MPSADTAPQNNPPARRGPMLRLIVGGVWLLGAAVFGLCYYNSYWRWRDCFNDQGRCFDPTDSVVYLEQSGAIWGGLAAICLGFAFMFVLPVILRPKAQD